VGLDEQTCRRLLDFLVDAKFLCRPDRADRAPYSRATDGFTERPSFAPAFARSKGEGASR
jgi:hypothetical protein